MTCKILLLPGDGIGPEVVAEVASDGSFARSIALPEHAGTHLDAPSHFVADGTTAEEIPAERLIVPAAVIDVRDACADFSDSRHGASFEAIAFGFGRVISHNEALSALAAGKADL